MEFDQKQQKIRKNAVAKNIRIRVYYICINYSRFLRKPVECRPQPAAFVYSL